ELLEELSRQSGVSLSTPDTEPESGIALSVFLHKVPLADAMNSLWSLVGYQQAEWLWKREGEPGNWRYLFLPTAGARDLYARTNRKIQAAFEDQAAFLLSAARSTPEDRKKLLGKRPELDIVLRDDRHMEGLNFLLESLSSEQLQRILRRQEI